MAELILPNFPGSGSGFTQNFPTVKKPSKEFYMEPMVSDDEAYQEVNDWYSTCRNYRDSASLVDKWAYFNRLYKNRITDIGDEANYPYRSKIFVPYTFQTIETILSRSISAVLASKPYISVFPREPGDEGAAPVMESYMDYQIDQIDSFFSKELIFQKQNFQFGKSYKKIYWKYKKIKLGNGKDSLIYDGPEVEPIAVWDVYVDPGAAYLQDAGCLIHCVYRSEEYLRQMASLGLYKNIDKVLDEKQTATGYEKEMQDRLQVTGTSDNSTQLIKKNNYLVKEYWSREKLIVVIGSTVVRNTRNPFAHAKIPFVDCNSYPLVAEFYGMGDIEPVSSLQEEINDIRNARMDNVNLMVHQCFLADTLSGLDDEIILSPGAVIRCDNINGIKPLAMPNLQSSAIRAEENLKMDFQTTSGVTDYAKGQASPGFADTATGVALLTEASNSRFDVKIRLLQESFKKMAEQIVGLDMQFVTQDMVFRTLGPDGALKWQTIKPEDISRNYDFVPMGSTLLGNKAMRQQAMLNLFGVLAKVPGINIVNFARRIMHEFEIKDADALFDRQVLEQAKQAATGLSPAQPGLPPLGQVAGGSPLLSLGGAGGQPMAPPAISPAMMGIPQGEGIVGTGVAENVAKGGVL